jgi:hypothetical protein
MRRKLLRAPSAVVAFLFLACSAFGDMVVTLDTAPLQGDAAGPFSLVFQLTDGSGTGDGNNSVALSNFLFGTGGPSGMPTTFGGVIGSVGSTVTLVDTSFLNYFIQPFTPGTTLEFTVATTNNVDAGGIPDGFAFSISDKTGQNIPTQAGPFADMFISIAFDSSNPAITAFASDTTRSPAGGGGPIDLGAPIVQVVPEPSGIGLLAVGLSVIFVLHVFKSLSFPPHRARSHHRGDRRGPSSALTRARPSAAAPLQACRRP